MSEDETSYFPVIIARSYQNIDPSIANSNVLGVVMESWYICRSLLVGGYINVVDFSVCHHQ